MTSPGMRRPLTWILVIIVVGVGVDQLTKAWAVHSLTDHRPVPIIADIFQLQLLRNPGAAFGQGSGMTVVFAVLALIVLVVLGVWVVPRVRALIWAVVIGLGMAGVAGNFIDRLVRPPGPFQGYVVDFFSLKYFAVFNVADIMLTAAAVIVVLVALVFRIDWQGHRASRQPMEAG